MSSSIVAILGVLFFFSSCTHISKNNAEDQNLLRNPSSESSEFKIDEIEYWAVDKANFIYKNNSAVRITDGFAECIITREYTANAANMDCYKKNDHQQISSQVKGNFVHINVAQVQGYFSRQKVDQVICYEFRTKTISIPLGPDRKSMFVKCLR